MGLNITHDYNPVRRLTNRLLNKKTLIASVAVAICAILGAATASFFLYNSVKSNLKLEANEVTIRAQIDEKTKVLVEAEDKIRELEDQISLVKTEDDKTRSDLEGRCKKLLKRTAGLNKKLKALKDRSLKSAIEEAIDKDDRPDVKTALTQILDKVERIMAGEIVTLEPIVVTNPGEGASKEAIRADAGSFTIVSLDRKNSLIAINAGRKDNLKEGDRLTLKAGGQEMASASVIAVRYRVASAFIDEMRRNYTIQDIKEGDEVVIAEKN